MYAKKLNRVIDVNDQNKDFYVNQGYDIYDGKKIIEHGKGASVSIAKYNEALAEIESFKAELEELKSAKAEKNEDDKDSKKK